MADTGWKSPASAEGSNWVNPTYIFASDNHRASYNFDSHSTPSSQLKATNFSFNIPVGATITGIEVSIERHSEDYSDEQQDSAVRILVADTATGDDKESAAFYPKDVDETVYYGGEGELWGLTITPADVNLSTFGVMLRVKDNCDDNKTFVNHMAMKVYYTVTYTEEFNETMSSTDTTLLSGEDLTFIKQLNDIQTITDSFTSEWTKIRSTPADPIVTRLVIDGTDYSSALDMNVTRTLGKSNSTSKFWITFANDNGSLKDTFNLNDEVVIYCDVGLPAAVTKIFTGVIEDVKFTGSEHEEYIHLRGRDYGAVLQDMTVQPVVFIDRDAGEIAKIIVQQNTSGIVTTNNVNVATGTILDRVAFNHKNVFDALQELGDLSGYYFYVDENKDIHFEVEQGISSGYTFNNSNIVKSTVRSNDNNIYNKVWVYGDRILTGATNVGGIGAGSVITLTDQPHNTNVLVDGVLQEIGGVYQMNDPATTANLKYVVDFNQKNIVFVSGTTAGDNIPASGTSNVTINYERLTPIVKYNEDLTSISDYGPKTKIFSDTSIKDYTQASDIAVSILADNKEPKIEIDIEVIGVTDIIPGQTAIVSVPFHNINALSYTILKAEYIFSKKRNLSSNVLRITLGYKIRDFIDVMKDQMLRTQALESGPLQGTLTRVETTIDTIPIDSHYEAWAINIGSNFVLHSAKHGVLHDTNSRIGYSDAGSALLSSGGYILI